MTSEKGILLFRLQEIEEESNLLKIKIQAIKNFVSELEFKEASLFDHVEDNPILVPTESAESAIPADAAPKKTRMRTKDGTMTASSIAHKLSKEFGMTITRESVIKVGKQINAKPTYCERQHISRYSPESVNMIMNLYRSFNSL